jgi:hypothetical protein
MHFVLQILFRFANQQKKHVNLSIQMSRAMRYISWPLYGYLLLAKLKNKCKGTLAVLCTAWVLSAPALA